MRKELFMNGVGIMAIINNEFYIEDELLEGYKRVNKNMFIEQLKKISYVCLTTYDEKTKQEYLDLINYVKEMK